jgi:outer membrane protein OmpA-like peptidoglycan-associated protein
MSADNLFKYAHALKGTGKYARAKRITRLYNKEIQKEEADESEIIDMADAREALLDNILNTEELVAIRNLSINSRYSDFAPMFHNEKEVVFASAMDSAFITTRRYKWNDQPFLDLYVGKLNEESGEVLDAVKFSKKVNTKYHEAGVSFSPDNSTMFFTRNNYGRKLKRDKNGINNLKIYQSHKINGEWSDAVELPFNSDEYSTGHPALSPDGKQLYFVSDMPGTIGSTDIFVADIREDGSFSEPRNLGPEINTEGKEMFPFINGSKLYFASDGHVGLGGLDIYEVAYNGTEGFLEVRNLGKPINSNKDDFSFIVKEATQKGFFASNRKGGKGDDDIYSFERLTVEATNENAIAGVATERLSGNKIPDALIQLLDENNRKLKEMVGQQDGSFVFEDLEGTTRYVLRVAKDGYKPHEELVTTLENQKVEVEPALERLEDRILVEDGIKKLRTDMIYFDFDKSAIRPDAAEELDKLATVMQEYPEMIIKIESHTDTRGRADYNKYLSDLRAKASRDYLIQQGIASDRIESAIGYGEERLLNECNGKVRCNAVKHERNRRSEFIIVSM